MSALSLRAARIARPVPKRLLHRLSGGGCLVPYYHMVSDERPLHTRHLYAHKSPSEFEHDLEVLLRSFHSVDAEELSVSVHGEGEASPAEEGFHLTFDDGFSEMSEVVAPILLRLGVPATFFINSAFLDNRGICYMHLASLLAERVMRATEVRYPTEAWKLIRRSEASGEDRSTTAPGRAGIPDADSRESLARSILSVRYDGRAVLSEVAALLDVDVERYLRERRPYLSSLQVRSLLNKGFTIGSHSVDHPRYQDLSLQEQIGQTVDSLRTIRSAFGIDSGLFAFPHSDHGVSREFFAEVRRSGLVEMSFGTSEMRRDVVPWNIQRFSLEKPVLPAEDLLAYQLSRRFVRRAVRRDVVDRRSAVSVSG